MKFKGLNIGDKFHPENEDWTITIQDLKDGLVYYSVYWKISPNGKKHFTTDVVGVGRSEFVSSYYQFKVIDKVVVTTNFFDDSLFEVS